MFPLYRLGFMPLQNSYWVGLSFLFKKKVSEEWKEKFCQGLIQKEIVDIDGEKSAQIAL